MDELELWALGLMTLGLGPPPEWKPSPPAEHQRFHNEFWQAVSDLMPDDEDDEPYWMTQHAAIELEANHKN